MEKENTGSVQKSRIVDINKSFLICLKKAEELTLLPPKEQINVMSELEKSLNGLSQMLKIAKLVAETGEDHERVVSC